MIGFEVLLEEKNGIETNEIVKKLKNGNPRIELFYDPKGITRGQVQALPNSFVINVLCLQSGDEEILAKKLCEVL